ADPEAWSIMCQFAQDPDMTLLAAEKCLQELLKDQFVYEHWQPALNAVMEAEGDVMQAAEAVQRLASATLHCTGLTIKIPAKKCPPQLITLEAALADSVLILKSHDKIIGPPPTVNEILNPKEEREVGKPQYAFEGGDAEIVAVVENELAIKWGEIVEIESDDDEDQQMPPIPSYTDLISMCQTLETACMVVSDANSTLELAQLLCKFRGTLS
ncbi:hypothetical protein M404DRAFT_162309, partial [Pisolithus tinctorius Marx 270]